MTEKSQPIVTTVPKEFFRLRLGLINNDALRSLIKLRYYLRYGNKIYLFSNFGTSHCKLLKMLLSMRGYVNVTEKGGIIR